MDNTYTILEKNLKGNDISLIDEILSYVYLKCEICNNYSLKLKSIYYYNCLNLDDACFNCYKDLPECINCKKKHRRILITIIDEDIVCYFCIPSYRNFFN